MFALALLIASAVMYTLILKPIYQLSRTASGIIPPPSTAEAAAKFMKDTNFYMRVQFALTVAFWTCLWVVKASFLAFFYPLSNGLKWDRRLWYAVAAFCVAGYIACVVSYPVSCSEFTVGKLDVLTCFELYSPLKRGLWNPTKHRTVACQSTDEHRVRYFDGSCQ